jgi:hypothetical protein
MLGAVSDRSDTPGPPGDLPVNLLSELFRAAPKLVDRTRSQAELVATLAGHLPCLGGLLGGLGTDRRRDDERPPADTHETVPIDVLSLLTGESSGVSATTPSGSNGSSAPDHAPAAGADADASSAVPAAAVPAEADLPIQDYDSLAASQVVPRLTTLSPEELRSVRSYELANRNRQTILNRVGQRLAD